MSSNLDAMTDAKLNELFASEVAKVKFELRGKRKTPYLISDSTPLPDYCNDANAVLPFLGELNQWSCINKMTIGYWWITVSACATPPTTFIGQSDTFARAAVIALIRAKRHELP